MTRSSYPTLVAATGLAIALAHPAPADLPAAPVPGTLVAVAGTGEAGFSGDGGPAIEATFDGPYSPALDAAGNLFVTDGVDRRVREVGADGIIRTVIGTGVHGLFGDNGPASKAKLNYPTFSTFDGSGNFYFMDVLNGRVRKVSPDGIITTLAGGGKKPAKSAQGGPATDLRIQQGMGLAADAEGNVYFADGPAYIVLKVNPAGMVFLAAGNGGFGFSGDGGLATQAELMTPTGLAVDASGNLFIVDFDNNRVRKVTPDGRIMTVAGNGKQGATGDGGLAIAATLNHPFQAAVDSAGNLFIGDWGNYRIRKVTPEGVISTVAGKGKGKPAGVGGPATEATLAGPMGLTIDAAGDLLFSDYNAGFGKNDNWEDPRILMVVAAAAAGLIAGKPFPAKP